MALSEVTVLQALVGLKEPETGKAVLELDMVRNVAVTGDAVRCTLVLQSPAYSKEADLVSHIERAFRKVGAQSVDIEVTAEVTRRQMLPDDPCPAVRNVLLVMSGKGGVGKSTVATNLAMALARSGASVGLLDADMYGPSIPTMFGVNGRPISEDGTKFLPLERFGVKLMSLGFMIPSRQAVVWRGPMLQSALVQFLKDVEWGALDYLVIDMPPGTGDIALTLSQKLKTSGAVVVTTPQEVALQDVYKSVSMAQKVGIPILGVIENESYFICDGCDKRHELFGRGGGQLLAEFAEVSLLGQLPIDGSVREWGDAGTPVVQAAPESAIGAAFMELAKRVAGRVTAQNLSNETPALEIDRSGGKNKHLPITR